MSNIFTFGANDFSCCVGSPDKILYSSKLEEDGTITLKESGKESLYDSIQSFADSCDLNVIMARYANGDVNALNKVQGVFGDFTDAPRSLAGMLQLVIDGQKTFEGLPLDVKQAFDNDFNKWFATAGSDDWLSKMKYESPVISSDPIPVPTDPNKEVLS